MNNTKGALQELFAKLYPDVEIIYESTKSGKQHRTVYKSTVITPDKLRASGHYGFTKKKQAEASAAYNMIYKIANDPTHVLSKEAKLKLGITEVVADDFKQQSVSVTDLLQPSVHKKKYRVDPCYYIHVFVDVDNMPNFISETKDYHDCLNFRAFVHTSREVEKKRLTEFGSVFTYEVKAHCRNAVDVYMCVHVGMLISNEVVSSKLRHHIIIVTKDLFSAALSEAITDYHNCISTFNARTKDEFVEHLDSLSFVKKD